MIKRLPLLTVFILNLCLFGYFLITGCFSWSLALIQVASLLILIIAHIPLQSIRLILLKKHRELEIIGIILVISLFSRMYKLDQITPGMWGDEITVARMALDLKRQTNFLPFVETNYGHPTPLLYLTAADMTLLGKSFVSIRLVSVVFGALAVIVLYLLLRQFFSIPIATTGSLLFSLAYENTVVSRLAYEVTPAIFFQLLSYLLLYLFWKKDKPKYLVLLGISTGLGIWTYLSFRLIAVGIICLVISRLWQKHKPRNVVKYFLVFAVSIFITTNMLIAYALRNPEQIYARTKAVSLFTQGLPPLEIAKELAGGTVRTLAIFILRGDPNTRQNPSSAPYLDIFTLGLFYFGAFMLLKQKRQFVPGALLLFIPVLLNDILATEFAPEFHYYGIGHPNALRIAGILPLVYFIGTFGLAKIVTKINKQQTELSSWLIAIIIAVPIVLINWHWYFNQPYSSYVYSTNGVREYNATLAINDLQAKLLLVSSTYINDPRYQFFVNPNVNINTFVPTASSAAQLQIPPHSVVVFDPRQNLTLANSIIEAINSNASSISGDYLFDPRGKIDTIVFTTK